MDFDVVFIILWNKYGRVHKTGGLICIANNAGVSEKTFRKAAQMMSVIKENSISSGNDPNAMAAAVLYGACLAQGEKLHQVQLADAANLCVVTLRKRLQDVRKVFPEVPNGPSKSIGARRPG